MTQSLKCSALETLLTQMEHSILVVPCHHSLADQTFFTLQDVPTNALKLLWSEKIRVLAWDNAFYTIIMPYA